MRIPRRGEKGFTLIELLIVIAILGVLAAVVIPNVGRFLGRGKTEAADTEFANIQTAVIAMMTDNGLSQLPFPVSVRTNNMGVFPDPTSKCAVAGQKVTDPLGVLYIDGVDPLGDKDGYLLYAHDITGGGSQNATVNYVATQTTSRWYTVDASGTVTQYASAP